MARWLLRGDVQPIDEGKPALAEGQRIKWVNDRVVKHPCKPCLHRDPPGVQRFGRCGECETAIP